MSIKATLCFIIKEKNVLLIHKKRGFGNGKWNGPGGKTKNGESLEDCVKRELKEEVGLVPLDIQNRGVLNFYFGKNKDEVDWIVHVFVAHKYDGVLTESEEAYPKWFDINDVPYDHMWEDDKIWLPHVLDGKGIKGSFIFSEDMQHLLEHELKILS